MKKINFENLPSTNTPVSAGNLNQMQSNIEESIDNLHPKTKTIWQGSLYETNSTITLTEPLEENNLYIFTFYGLSSTYLIQFPFTYKGVNFQVAYYDGTDYFRMRLDITSNASKVTVNENSINNASNTALIAIEKVC